MRPLKRMRWLIVAFLLCLPLLLSGCGDTIDRLGDALYPTETPGGVAGAPAAAAVSPTVAGAVAPAPTAVATAKPVAPAAAQPAAPATTQPIAPAARPAEGYYLLFARGGSILRGDYGGNKAVEVAAVGQLDVWDFHAGLLALTQGRNVDILDLKRGAQRSVILNTKAEVEDAQVLWGVAGKALLHVALVVDKGAKATGHSIEMRVLNPADGAERALVRLSDVSGVNVLRYEEDAERIFLIQQGAEAAFKEVAVYDVKAGKLAGVVPAPGEGDALLSADGRYLLAQQFGGAAAQLVVHDLTAPGKPRVWTHPANAHSLAHVWSPDGRYVAYLLRDGKTYWDESSKGLGVWVLDLNTMQAKKVLDEASLTSTLVGWSPESATLLGYHRTDAKDTYFYTVKADGSDRRTLALGVGAEVLGWMSAAEGVATTKVVVDPWPGRFQAAGKDGAAVAQVMAQFVATQGNADEKTLSQQVQQSLTQAGWKFDGAGPNVRRVSEGAFVAYLPPLALYVLEGGRAAAVASGQVVFEARLEGSDLGLIYGVQSGGGTQPAYMLLRRQADGSWKTLWTPQGQRDWVASDGLIRFTEKGLQGVQVTGTSFGLDSGVEEVFSECRSCLHRSLSATWVREGDRYVRQTKLAANAPLEQALWEMTEAKPYAVLYECLRRARKGQNAQELAKDAAVLARLTELGLADKATRLIAESEAKDTVLFRNAANQARYRATVQGGKVVGIEAVK